MTIKDDEYFMREALKEAHQAYKADEIPIGAVIVCKNQIIARAHNLSERLNDATAHAEMQAITSAANFIGSKYLHDCSIYITLEPCIMCAGALHWTQISRVIYGASELKPIINIELSTLLHPKAIITKGILKDECAGILTEYFKTKRIK